MGVQRIINRLKNENITQVLKKYFCGQMVDFSSEEYEVEVLCEQETKQVGLPIFIKSHLSKITAAVEVSDLQAELEWLYKTEMVYGATKLYRLQNVTIDHTGVWVDPSHYIGRNVKKNTEFETVNLKSAVLVDCDNSSQYFGHWMSDFLPATLVAKDIGHQALSLSQPDYMHADGYLNLYEVDNVIYSNKGFIEELYVLDDFFTLNSYKMKRFNKLSETIKSKVKPLEEQYAGVYIARGVTGVKRTLSNEEAMANHLRNKGFYILHAESETPETIASILLNTSFVISIEGSALNHAMLTAADNAGFLILMPPNRCCFYFKAILDAFNRAWGFYVCKKSENDDASFYIDSFDELDQLIDKIRNKAENLTLS